MDWTKKYLCPLIEREDFSRSIILDKAKDFWESFKHSLWFHKQSKNPKNKLPDLMSENVDDIYSISKDIFDRANDRIDKLEQKAVQLIPYISALLVFISFAFIKISWIIPKFILIIVLFMLLFAITISCRCIIVKNRRELFILDVFDFDKNPPEDNFDKKNISKNLMQAAIYNQNVADNTADILKSAISILIMALVLSIIGLLFWVFGYFVYPSNSNTVKIDNQINLTKVESRLEDINKSLNETNNNQINNLNSIKSDYNILLKRIEILEKQKNKK